MLRELRDLKRRVARAVLGTSTQGRFARLSVSLWDNWARLDHNLVHAAHHALCRTRYRPRAASQAAQEASRALAEHGMCVVRDALDPALVARVAARSRVLLEQPAACFRPEGVEEFITHVKDSARAAPEMLQLLTPDIVSILERTFRSHFKIYYTEIYRTHPTSEQARKSWLWHSDNHPGAILKVMVYLNDVTSETGALRAHPWPVTRSLYRRGFRDRTRADRFASELDDPRNSVVMEGKAGTVLVFDNNLIHKATAPLHGHRDVAVFEVIPSMVPWDEHLPGALDRVGLNQAYPTNPFRV